MDLPPAYKPPHQSCFRGKTRFGIPHGSPEPYKDAKFWQVSSDAKFFDVIGLVMTALCYCGISRCEIKSCGQLNHWCRRRRRGHFSVKSFNSFIFKFRAVMTNCSGAIPVMAHIFFSAPSDLYRNSEHFSGKFGCKKDKNSVHRSAKSPSIKSVCKLTSSLLILSASAQA